MNNYNVLYVNKKILVKGNSIPTVILAKAAYEANEYLQNIHSIFQDKNINLFEALGVTNISATVGEIYARFLCKQLSGELVSNPHPDGRPDVLTLFSKEAKNYYLKECFETKKTKKVPIKSKLTPFKFGGIEIKCTIGNFTKNKVEKYLKEIYNTESFPIGAQRVKFLENINWVAHHVQDVQLLGLYYDYVPECNNAPQVIAGFFDTLDASSWNPVSHGSADKKTTSMTSINSKAQKELKRNCVFMIDIELYKNKLSEIGVEMK